MAEPPHAILPYDDPNYLHTIEHLLMRDDLVDSAPLNASESPSSLHQNDFPVNLPMLQSPADYETMHSGDPLNDDLLFLDNEMFEEGFETDPSRVHQDEPNLGDNVANESTNFGNPIRLATWPLQVPAYTCSCCQVLREITHTNGVEITKLEVHGRLGVISHAVLEKYGVDLTTNQSREYKMFEFCNESISRVKQFLVEYCNERKTNGYVMLQDPLSGFYEAVCVGLDWEYSMDNTDDLIPGDSGDHQMNQLPGVENNSGASISNKTTFSMQRERAGKLTIRDFLTYFNFPIEVAAKKIQVCPTVIKKICRKHGLSRWPYRKIKSIERTISKRAKYLTSVDVEERNRAQSEIDNLRQEIANIYARYNG